MGIIIKDLTKKYGNQLALDKVSFSIKNGEVVGLLGPNGAGKSTLMKSITNAINPDTGDILINDFHVTNSPIETKEMIGFLQENNPLYMEMYVKEYLEFVTNVRKVPKTKIDEVIEKVGLTPEKHKKNQSIIKRL